MYTLRALFGDPCRRYLRDLRKTSVTANGRRLDKPTPFDHGSNDVLRRHESDFLVEAALDNRRVNNQAGANVLEENQTCVCAKVQLR